MKRPVLSLKTPRQRARKYLATFPAIQNNLPLAVGVHRKLIEHAPVSGRVLRRELWRHTQRTRYLNQLAKPDSQRHWLDGTPVGPVTKKHRKNARKVLAGGK